MVSDTGRSSVLTLRAIASDASLLEVGRRAIQDSLVKWRDYRLFSPGKGNGFVIREADGSPSDIIRFGPEVGLRIALEAIADHVEQGEGSEPFA